MATSKYDPTTFGYQNFYSALLTADITSGSLTIALDTVPSPTAGVLVIDPDSATNREVIYYSSKGVSNVVCPSDGRAWASTTAVAHLTGTTVIMADVDEYFKKLASGELSTDPLRTELFFDYIASGGVISISSGLVGATSNIVFYLNGRRYSGTIANKTYTVSKDTYVDVTGNSDGSITVAYNEVGTNLASPVLATNYIRLGIVITSGAAITSINQGQESAVFPIASSIPYAVTDSLGNLICPRDPNRKILGYRQILTSFAGAANTSSQQITGLTCPVIVPTGRKVKITVMSNGIFSSTGTATINIAIWDGTAGSGTQLGAGGTQTGIAGFLYFVSTEAVTTPSTASKTYNASVQSNTGANAPNVNVASANPTYIKVELA